MNLNDAVNYLLSNGYLLKTGDKIVVTNKLIREYGEESPTLSLPVPTREPLPVSQITSVIPLDKEKGVTVTQGVSMTDLYKAFIKEAEVPTKIAMDNGPFYWTDRYSEKGEKEFVKIFKSGKYDMRLFTLMTKLYYKQTKYARKAIGNFLTEKIYVSFYDDFERLYKEGKLIDYLNDVQKENKGDTNILDL